MALSPEQNRIFDEYDKLFLVEGWKMFVEDIRQNQRAVSATVMSPACTEQERWFCLGRDDVYKTILGLKDLLDQLRKQAEETDNDEVDNV